MSGSSRDLRRFGERREWIEKWGERMQDEKRNGEETQERGDTTNERRAFAKSGGRPLGSEAIT